MTQLPLSDDRVVKHEYLLPKCQSVRRNLQLPYSFGICELPCFLKQCHSASISH